MKVSIVLPTKNESAVLKDLFIKIRNICEKNNIEIKNIFIADDSHDDTRKIARENNVYLRVVRNTLLKMAVADTEFECIQEVLVGPTILAFSQEDPGAAARVLKDFAKENKAFEIKALSVGGKLLDASQIDVLATLPTHDQALSILMSVMLAPVTKLARTLIEVPTKATRAVAAVRDQKQEAA